MSKEDKINVNNEKEASKFDLDDILKQEVGQLGKYQVVTVLLAAFPVIFAAIATGEYIFTTARIPTRCRIPECDGENSTFAASWVLNAIPGTGASSFDNCRRYRNSSLVGDLVGELVGECPAEWFTSETERCQQYVYQNSLSIVHDFGLACDEWRRSLIGSIRTIGSFLALPITGYVSDRWGRRVALILNTFNTGLLGLLRSFINSYEWFLVTAVIETTAGAGAFSSCYIMVTELVGPKYRVIVGTTVSTMFATGQVCLGLLAWAVPSWRSLTQVLFAPQLLIIFYFWLMSESVRWLMSRGRHEEAEMILKKVAKMNKRELSDSSLQALRASAVTTKLQEKSNEAWLPILVIRSRVMLLRCAVSPIWWITTTMIYYGMGINAVNLSGNSYLNYVYVALVEIPGYWTAILLLDRIGRKPVLIGGYWLCAACQFAFAFMPAGRYGLSLSVYLIGKYSIATVVTTAYVYTAELYPTKHRHSLFAFSSMMGRLGAIAAPLTPALALTVWESFPSVLFGSFALLSGALIFLTPETLGTKLPDTMEEAERLGLRK